MNVAKLMARLNPKSVPLEFRGARGTGAPALTAIDIAAALGVAGAGGHRDRLAVDVLCLRWWPARVEGPARTVSYRLVHHYPDAHKRLKLPMTKFTSACCEKIPVEAPSETPAFQHIAAVVERKLRCDTAGIKDRTRLDRTGFMPAWARAVIHEYRHPNHCPVCKHFGQPGSIPRPVEVQGKIVRFEWLLCDHCGGDGVMPWGKYRRAKALRMREGTYRALELNDAHEAALSWLREKESTGALLVLGAL